MRKEKNSLEARTLIRRNLLAKLGNRRTRKIDEKEKILLNKKKIEDS